MSAQPSHAGREDIFDLITLGDINGPPAWCCYNAKSLRCSAGEITVLRVEGEVDLYTLPTLPVALDNSLKRRPAHLVVDLAQVTFCSVRGLDLLTRAGHTAAEEQTGYAVSGVLPHLDRVWSLGWDDDLPVRYRSIVVAVAAIRAVG